MRLRFGLLGFSLASLVAAHILLGAGLWLGADEDAFAFLQPFWCIVPLLCQLNFPRYFGLAWILVVAGIVGLVISGGASLRPPSAPDLNALPGPLQFVSLASRRMFQALLVFALLVTGWFEYLTIFATGGPPPALWLASLALMAAVFYYADHASGRRSFLSRNELLLLLGYFAYLLLLTFAFREPVTRVTAISIATVVGVWLWRRRPSMREHVAVALLATGALAVYTFDLTSWRYSFIGDEYAFFEFANNLINAAVRPYLLSPMGAYDVHPVFASYVQAATITLFGNDIYGWRISETLAVMLAALPLYVIIRAFVKSRAGLLALMIYLASQHLLGLTKVGYTYSQLFVPLLGGLALFVLALRRGSLLGLFLSGAAAAFAFYTFAFGIPFIALPVLMFVLCLTLPRSKTASPVQSAAFGQTQSGRTAAALWSLIPSAAALLLGIGLTALPSLSDTRAFERIAGHTVAHSEVRGANNLTEQVLPNFLYTLNASLAFQGHSHYVSGPHLDPLSSLMMLLGIAAAIAAIRRNRMGVWLLSSFTLACMFAGGLAPYPYPPIARTYILVPFYALFAALGASRLFAWLEKSMAARIAAPLWVFLMVAIPALNLYQFFVLTDRHNPQEQVAMVVREFQTQAPDATIFVVEQPAFSFNVTRTILRAYHLNADRLRAVTEESASAGLTAILSGSSAEVLVKWDLPARDRWRSDFRRLFPDQSESIIADASGVRHYVRLGPGGGSADPVRRPPPGGASAGEPFVVAATTLPQALTSWSVQRPRDIAMASDGMLYVINGSSQSIEVHAPDGNYVRSLPGAWQEPFALAFNSRQQLLVLDSRAGTVSLLRTNGTLISRSDPDAGLSSPRGLALDANDQVYVADTGNARIMHFDAELLSPALWATGAPLQQPAALAFVGGKLIAADGISLYVLARSGDVISRWTITGYNTVEPPHILPNQSELVVMTDPEAGEIVVYDLQGHVVQRVGSPAYERLRKPLGLAAAGDGRVFVTEYEASIVHVFDWRGP